MSGYIDGDQPPDGDQPMHRCALVHVELPIVSPRHRTFVVVKSNVRKASAVQGEYSTTLAP
jgi:hypothetical protein